MPVYDAESMSITAGKVDRIADDFRASQAEIRGVEGTSPFGDVEDPGKTDTVSGTLSSFTNGMREEFATAATLVSAASTALRDAVRAMAEADAVAADDLALRDAR